MPENGDGDKFKRIIEKINAASANFFDRRRDVEEASHDTFKWLRENKRFYSADGAENNGNWWLSLPSTDNDILIDLREFVFRCHLFDNGIRNMIDNLVRKDIIQYDDEMNDAIEFAVGYESMAIHHEMMGYVASGSTKVLTLADVARRFNFASPVRLRDRRLAPMAKLGMWRCAADETSYSVSLGLPAQMFHLNAFAPIKKAFVPSAGSFAL